MFTLTGRTCVFSGSDGVVTRELLKSGMNVALLTHNMERVQRSIDEMGELGKNCIAVQCEADIPEDVENAYRTVYERFGSIDVVIPKHTGAPKQKDVSEYTLEELKGDMGIIVGGSFNMVQKALPYLEKSKAGRVILMSAPGCLTADSEEPLTNAISRGAIVSMTYALAARLATCGITVNSIAFGGYVQTHGKEPTAEQISAVASKVPVGRVGESEDLAAAVCYLASEEAGFVTGEVFNLNGGMHVG